MIKSKEQNKIFGGYTDIPWTNSGAFKLCNGNSFIFSIKNDNNFIVYKCLDMSKEVYHKNTFIEFGNSNLTLYGDNNIKKDGYASLGKDGCYEVHGMS